MLYYAVAATTAVAGILHLVLAYNGSGRGLSLFTIFFIISGIAQIFWAGPMIKRWGRIWYYIGIIGTIILIIMWSTTRLPGNPPTGREGSINDIGIAIEVLQSAYIVLTAIIIAKEKRSHSQIIKNKSLNKYYVTDPKQIILIRYQNNDSCI